MKKGFQLVKWFPEWQGFHFLKPLKDSDIRFIYDWFLYLGYWEIRKWHKLKEGELV